MNSQETPEPTNSQELPATKKERPWIDLIADRLTSTGVSWARQSLAVGKRALETSAKTLSQTAGTLDELAHKLERGNIPKNPPDAPGSA